MQRLLLDIHHTAEAAEAAGGLVPPAEVVSAISDNPRPGGRRMSSTRFHCPQWERGQLKRSKAKDLLERLWAFGDDVLRFMEVDSVPFTNNQSENDLRMTKVQRKISGCFRSMEGAQIFCRIRSYLSTCRKQGMTVTDALTWLFQGKQPLFMNEDQTQGGE